jgi:hypothetical protein
MSWIKSLKYVAILFLIPIFLVAAWDQIFGKEMVEHLKKMEDLQYQTRIKNEQQYRIKNPIYHHDLAANYQGMAYFSSRQHMLCTDKSGFKKNCDKDSNEDKDYDVAFIGDSFTEGVGLPYEKTFVGLVAELSGKKIANLAVASYSPSIYYSKLKYYLDRGYKFKEVIVLIDISDIQDEGVYYRLEGDEVKSRPLEGDPNKFDDFTQIESGLFYRNANKFCMNDYLPIICKTYKDHRDKRRNQYIVNHHPRGDWTFNQYSQAYGEFGIAGAINITRENMLKLYEMLIRRGIKLSLGVYPWPEQILFDNENSKQVEIWREFCQGRCNKFYNAFPSFFERINETSRLEVAHSYYFSNDVHFNEAGNKEIARIIIKTGLD